MNFYQNQQGNQPKTIQGQNVGVDQVQNILQQIPKSNTTNQTQQNSQNTEKGKIFLKFFKQGFI